MFPLLISGTNPKFVFISAGAGSITHAPNFNIEFTAYGSSKAAANYLIEKIQGEHQNLSRSICYLEDVIQVHCFFWRGATVCFPIHPGVVDTDLCESPVVCEHADRINGS